MNTYTDAQIATLIAAGIDLNEFFGRAVDAHDLRTTTAPVVLQPAARAEAHAEVLAAQAPTTKPLTRSAWKTLRTTKAGKVRKQFAGMTREQALEAGLCEGYHMPTGEMRVAMAEYGRTGEFDRA